MTTTYTEVLRDRVRDREIVTTRVAVAEHRVYVTFVIYAGTNTFTDTYRNETPEQALREHREAVREVEAAYAARDAILANEPHTLPLYPDLTKLLDFGDPRVREWLMGSPLCCHELPYELTLLSFNRAADAVFCKVSWHGVST